MILIRSKTTLPSNPIAIYGKIRGLFGKTYIKRFLDELTIGDIIGVK